MGIARSAAPQALAGASAMAHTPSRMTRWAAAWEELADEARTNAESLAGALATSGLVGDRTYRLQTYPRCIVAAELVAWMISTGWAQDEDEAVVVGQQLVMANLLRHVSVD